MVLGHALSRRSELLAWPKSHNGPAAPCRGARREHAPGAVTVPRVASTVRWPAADPRTRCGEGGGRRIDEVRATHRARGGKWGLTDGVGRRWGEDGVARRRLRAVGKLQWRMVSDD
jgi:hypothetical protein